MNKRRKCDKNTSQYSKPSHTNLQGNWSAGFSVYRGKTDRHTHRQTETHTDRHTHRQTHTQTDTHTDRHTHRQTHTQTDVTELYIRFV